jgi:hypothetical protein
MADYLNKEYRISSGLFPMTLAVLLAGRLLGLHRKALTKRRLLLLKITTFVLIFMGASVSVTFFSRDTGDSSFGVLGTIFILLLVSLFYFLLGYDRFPTDDSCCDSAEHITQTTQDK